MFSSGDRVIYKELGSTYNNKLCTIKLVTRAVNGYLYTFEFDDGTVMTETHTNLYPIPQFQIGDRVRNTCQFDPTAWPIGHEFVVERIYNDGTLGGKTAAGWSGAIHPMYCELVFPPAPNITLSNMVYPPWITDVELPKVVFSAESPTTLCNHEWTTYIGLSKKMDICKKCPAFKNERGIYE